MHKREVFDKVAKHLLDQGRQSKVGDTCTYRGHAGLSCAVGCLIPDELYDRSMESWSVDHLIDNYPKIRELFGEHRSLLLELQRLHDRYPGSLWEWHLEKMKENIFEQA